MRAFWLRMAARQVAFALRMRAVAKENRRALQPWASTDDIKLATEVKNGCGAFDTARRYLAQAKESLALADGWKTETEVAV